MLRTFAFTTFAALLVVTSPAQTGVTIRIWTVGSPHTGETPDTRMPPGLAREAANRGWRLSVEAFPADGFATRFFAAARDGSPPDVVVFDNFGVMDGITVGATTIAGIGQDSATRKQLVPAARLATTPTRWRCSTCAATPTTSPPCRPTTS